MSAALNFDCVFCLLYPRPLPQSGLRVTLNVDTNNYASLLTPDVGVRVLVHPPDQLPFPEERGFSVVPGFSTAVGISRVRRAGSTHFSHTRRYCQ